MAKSVSAIESQTSLQCSIIVSHLAHPYSQECNTVISYKDKTLKPNFPQGDKRFLHEVFLFEGMSSLALAGYRDSHSFQRSCLVPSRRCLDTCKTVSK